MQIVGRFLKTKYNAGVEAHYLQVFTRSRRVQPPERRGLGYKKNVDIHVIICFAWRQFYQEDVYIHVIICFVWRQNYQEDVYIHGMICFASRQY